MTLELNGRVTVYTNQTPFEADILRSNTYKMVDVSKLAQTVLGTGINNTTLASGLPCAPIAPPGLQVTVGPGCLYSYQFYEATPYGVLPADTDPNHQLYKQALNFNPVVLNTPAPVTIGNSIIYLVQAAFETVDTNVISRPYYNSADPTSPIFNSLSDTRQDIILINAKSGIEAPSPTPPTPDAGFVGLYYVTIAFGQTSVVGGNITIANNAPFITESLTQKISYASVIDQKYTYFQDTGAVNALVVTPSTGYSSFPNGATISVRAANTVTGASNITIGSLGSIPIKVVNPSGLSDTAAGQIISGGIYTFTSDGTVAQLSNPSQSVLSTQTEYFETYAVVDGAPPARAVNDVIPINTNGIQILSLTITPLFAGSNLEFDIFAPISINAPGNGTVTIALYQDATVNALAISYFSFFTSQVELPIPLKCKLNPPLVPGVPTTFNIRIMNDGGHRMTMNGRNGVRQGGGVLGAFIKITETK
ncbi:hypothetical protein UFOVP459_8 [uncultured Caudovirales phage]|uniref:Uncharacterized protein n=3 Tax=uncultured Caudovirales phage TaxID=2100421 RepID=A0A6J5MDU0_9CAUD|nr:hypothetical protein UFOVP459_8 [uncultured Caudovirales phage]CAB4212502.1 hypothetical protein UFOVP1443_20 [uncultured Caudovirales phage]